MTPIKTRLAVLLAVLSIAPPAFAQYWRKQPEATPEVEALLKSCGAALRADRDAEARDLAAKALARSLAVHDLIGEARSLCGLAQYPQGADPEGYSRARYDRALAIWRELGNRLKEADVLLQLAESWWRSRNLDQARELLAQAVAIYREQGDPIGTAEVLERLGRLSSEVRKFKAAIAYETEALELFRQRRNLDGEVDALLDLHHAYTELRMTKESNECVSDLSKLVAGLEDRRKRAYVLEVIGWAWHNSERPEEALPRRMQALELYRELKDDRMTAFMLGRVGDSLANVGRPGEALARFDESIALSRRCGDSRNEMVVSRNAGHLALATNRARQAVKYFEATLKLARKLGDRVERANTTSELVSALLRIGEVARATAIADAAIEDLRKCGDARVMAALWARIAEACCTSTDFADGVEFGERALRCYSGLKDMRGQARSLIALGALLNGLGLPNLALRRYSQAIAIANSIGDTDIERAATCRAVETAYGAVMAKAGITFARRALEMLRGPNDLRQKAQCLSALATFCVALGSPVHARQHMDAAVACIRQTGNKKLEAWMLTDAASRIGYAGDGTFGMHLARRALGIYRGLGDGLGEAGILCDISFGHALLGQSAKAISLQERSLAIFRKHGLPQDEAFSTGNFAWHAFMGGDVDHALEYYRRSLTLFTKFSAKREEAGTLNNLGYLYRELGLHDQAIASHKRALELSLPLRGWVSTEAAAGLGMAYSAAGKDQMALRTFREALRLGSKLEGRPFLPLVQLGLGEHWLKRGKVGPALKSYRRALQIAENGDWLPDPYALRGVGECCRIAGNWAKALKYHRNALALTRRRRNSPALEASLLADIGSDLEAGGRLSEASRSLRQAVDTLERLRGSFGDRRDLKTSFLAGTARIYRHAARVLLRQGRVKEAFEMLQRCKARTLLVMIRTPRTSRATSHSLSPAGETFPAASLASMARIIPEDTAVLEYGVMNEAIGSKGERNVALFVLSKSHGRIRLSVHWCGTSLEDLRRTIAELRRGCSERGLPWPKPARSLYRALLLPAEAELADKRRLIVCPDGALWNVPFQVLADAKGVCLLERFEIVYGFGFYAVCRSLSKWFRRSRLRGPRALILSDPGSAGTRRIDLPLPSNGYSSNRSPGLANLPGAVAEAAQIRRQFPGSLLLSGARAQEGTVKQVAGRYGFLHFATHAYYNGRAPMMSLLALAAPPRVSWEDGFLTALEIAGLDLRAELVVLSACDTQRGQIQRGEGLVGLAWAFSVAGTRAQLVTQWAVDDSSTAEYMRTFYGLLKRGVPKGRAAREAALALMRKRKTSHPFHWAPFVLMGDWR